jgi:DNA-binding CsgD family transcriptional regulator
MAELLLSPREKRMLRRLAQGMSDAEIAASIGGRADQVKNQRVRLLNRLQMTSQAEIIETAQRFAPWHPAKAMARQDLPRSA